MNKSKEVAARLLVSGRNSTILLDQVDEPLDLLPFLVQMLVIITRHLPVLLRGDDRLGPLPFRRLHHGIAVVRLIEDVGIRLMTCNQRLGLGDVGLLTRRQDELDGVAQGVDDDVDFGTETAPRATKGLIALPPFFPAAC